jgi:23S rRNA (pseudouridine1915-N3)-methyltransferase
MKITLLCVGKTQNSHFVDLIAHYQRRLTHYTSFEKVEIESRKKKKNLSKEEQKKEEGSLILDKLQPSDFLVLLDDKGKQMDTLGFANDLQKKLNSGMKSCVFVVGGSYGFSDQVYKRANEKLSLSKMTLTHQMVRLLFIEQLYRAFTVLRNEPYHHE